MTCNQCGNEIFTIQDYHDSHNCIHCVRKKRNEYMRQYNKAHKKNDYSDIPKIISRNGKAFVYFNHERIA